MNNINDMINKIYELFEKKQFDESIKVIDQTVEQLLKEPDSSFEGTQKNDILCILYDFKGFNYLGLDDVPEARKCFEKALELNPNSSDACAGLAECFYLEAKDDEAKIMYEWAIDNNPLNQFAINGLTKVNKRLGLPDNHNTLNIDYTVKKREEYYKHLTDAYKLFNEKKYQEALDKLAEVEKIFAASLPSKSNLVKISNLENFKGFNYLAMNDLESARKCFEYSLQINPQSSQACCGLGEIFFLSGKDDEAKQMYEWAVKNNPNNPFAVEGLKKVNRELGFPDLHNRLFLT